MTEEPDTDDTEPVTTVDVFQIIDHDGANLDPDARQRRVNIYQGRRNPEVADFEDLYEYAGAEPFDISSPEAIRGAMVERWKKDSGVESGVFLENEARTILPGDVIVFQDTAYVLTPFEWEEIDIEIKNLEEHTISE